MRNISVIRLGPDDFLKNSEGDLNDINPLWGMERSQKCSFSKDAAEKIQMTKKTKKETKTKSYM